MKLAERILLFTFNMQFLHSIFSNQIPDTYNRRKPVKERERGKKIEQWKPFPRAIEVYALRSL
jgi:hypothetical protein